MDELLRRYRQFLLVCEQLRIVMRQLRLEFFRYTGRLRFDNQGIRQSPCECCDSSLCFIVTRTRSSEERVLSTATLRTMLPFNPVSPA